MLLTNDKSSLIMTVCHFRRGFMPKNTYFNLNDEKKKMVYDTLRCSFEKKSIRDITVKELVDELKIPRGSFYQYFDSIEDAYFYVLEKEIVEIHDLFLNLLRDNNLNLISALDLFANILADEIFKEKNYKLYRSRYISFDTDLENKWKALRSKNPACQNSMFSLVDCEKLNFISSVVHSLVKRLFNENWDRKDFLDHYKLYINWIKEGIR